MTVLAGQATPLPPAREEGGGKLDATLQARLDPEVKAAWMARAHERGIRPGDMLRGAIAAVLAANPTAAPEGDLAGPPPEPDVRVTLPLRPHEVEAVDRAAGRLGWRRNVWLVSVVRSHVFQEPRPTETERQALTRSNAELLAVGRNLNQIAHALHRDDRYKDSVTVKRLDELRATITSHVGACNALLEAVENRWSPPEGFRPETS